MTEPPVPLHLERVEATVRWGGASYRVEGRLNHEFVVENGRLHVRLDELSLGAPSLGAHEEGTGLEAGVGARMETGTVRSTQPGGEIPLSLWVPADAVTAQRPFLLRSELWELPAGAERDLVLRTLVIALSDHIRAYGHRVWIARQSAGSVELLVTVHVPVSVAVDYLSALLPGRHRCGPRRVPWRSPSGARGERSLASDKDRAMAAYHVGYVPNWLEDHQFWSLIAWSPADGTMAHTVQFSLPDRYQRALQQRFRFQQRAP